MVLGVPKEKIEVGHPREGLRNLILYDLVHLVRRSAAPPVMEYTLNKNVAAPNLHPFHILYCADCPGSSLVVIDNFVECI